MEDPNPDQTKNKVYYHPNLPKNFFDDMILLPAFYKPENSDVEISTHNSIRNLLFVQTLQKLKKIEFYHVKTKEDYFKFKEIAILENKPSVIDNYLQRARGVNLIKTLKWQFERKSGPISYKVKYYHDTKNETFYEKIIPGSLFDWMLLKYYIFRKAF